MNLRVNLASMCLAIFKKYLCGSFLQTFVVEKSFLKLILFSDVAVEQWNSNCVAQDFHKNLNKKIIINYD